MEVCVLSYRSKTGDTVERIVWLHYERQNDRLVEMVLNANPGLADHGAVLPEGVLVILPEIEDEPVSGSVRLWG